MKWGGRVVAEVQNPFHRKRVSETIRQQVSALLEPGDVLITRHDDALSNLFLPGFWPHGALYIGTEAQREALGVDFDEVRRQRASDPHTILEAKKDGVLFRRLEETLRVDSFAVLRPRLSDADRATCLGRASTHEGKLYDFDFDFTRADRLVCTEVVLPRISWCWAHGIPLAAALWAVGAVGRGFYRHGFDRKLVRGAVRLWGGRGRARCGLKRAERIDWQLPVGRALTTQRLPF